jgi:hypothetical protein
VSTTRRERSDLRLLRIYAFTIPTVMRYKPDTAWSELSPQPQQLLARLDAELAGEASRYRALFAAMIAVLLMPALLAAFLWSGLYWLPVRIPWYPFFRGEYGLPWLSLFEWLAFLFLALFLVYGWALLRTSREETRRMAADLAVLASAGSNERDGFAREALVGHYPRAELLLRKAAPLSPYRELLAEGKLS